ncbi:DUF3048 domain-containing protein [soil metagenome]
MTNTATKTAHTYKPRTLTTRLVLFAALAAATVGCDSGDGADGAKTATDPTAAGASTPPVTTPVDPSTVYPLTGLPITDAAAATRPAMVVKIDNDASARPQAGLNQADIVFEEIIEAQTRFAAVFQSQGSDPVGPIRSGRQQDIDLLGSLNQPLFVYSGANPGVAAAIEASDLVDLTALDNTVYTNGGFFRDEARAEPFNEYAQTSQLWTLAPDGAGPPPPQFHYHGADDEMAGDPSGGVDVYLEGVLVGWRYDAATGDYLRTHDGVPHVDVANEQISTRNVVIMVVDYFQSAADSRSPEADTIGFGEAWVFSGGAWVRGVWTRADRLSPIELSGPNGRIELAPGRTWVELARVGTFSAAP